MEFKRIKSLKQYSKYCNLLEELVFKELKKDQDRIELLLVLIEDYDNRTIEELGNSKRMNPVELLIDLMEDHSISKSELARQLEVSRQLITEIVNYKRNISKRMLMKLSKRFKMRPEAFSREYNLISSKRRVSAV